MDSQHSENGMPHLSEALDVPLGSSSLPMPKLTAVDEEMDAVQKDKVVCGGPLRPKPRFYFNKDDPEEMATTSATDTPRMLNKSISSKHTKKPKIKTYTVAGGRIVRVRRKKSVFHQSDLLTPRKKLAVGMSERSLAGEKLDVMDEGEVGGLNHNNISIATGSNVDKSEPRRRLRPRLPIGRSPIVVRKKKVPKAVVEKKSTSTLIHRCASCQDYMNIKGHSEKFLVCTTCSASYHQTTCANISNDLADRIRSTGKWECVNCQTCSLCSDTLNFLSTICARCADGFHLKCVKLKAIPCSWHCDSCRLADRFWKCEVKDLDGENVEEEGKVEEVIYSTPVKRKSGPKPKRTYIRKGKKDNGRRARCSVVREEQSPEKLKPSSSGSATEVSVKVSSPTKHEPIQTKHEPTPTNHEPIPTKHEPIQTNHEPIPTNHEPIPTKHEPIQTNHEPIPTKHEPIQTNHEPIQTNHEPIPASVSAPTAVSIPTSTHSVQAGTQVPIGAVGFLVMSVPWPLCEFPINPASWNSRQIEFCFGARGLKVEGALFRAQEIDGEALMLLTRKDIIRNMGLKLGPALKVHRLVAELQSRCHWWVW